MTQEFEDIVSQCRVGFGAYVGYHEMVFVDDGPARHMAQVLGWNDLPTVFVQRFDNNKQEEVEPWRIRKIVNVQP